LAGPAGGPVRVGRERLVKPIEIDAFGVGGDDVLVSRCHFVPSGVVGAVGPSPAWKAEGRCPPRPAAPGRLGCAGSHCTASTPPPEASPPPRRGPAPGAPRLAPQGRPR